MAEAVLNTLAQTLVDLTLCKTRYDEWDLQWYTEGPFWRRTNMRFSREYKIIPDYEIGDAKHGKSLRNIEDEAGYLYESLVCYGKQAQPEEARRVKYLTDHAGHLHMRTRMLMGEKPAFDSMTEQLYALRAPVYDYTRFDDIMDELNQALPGSGGAREKVQAFRKRLAIPREALLRVITDTTREFHEITCRRMNVTGNSMPRVRVRELPNESMVFLSILFGYDYNSIEYERNFNLLYPWTVDRVMEYVGHEMEPGHLTYFEKRLQAMIDNCWPEMGIVSQFSSSSAFSEGASRHAIAMSFDNSMERQVEFEREFIFKNAGLDTALAGLMPLWHRYCEIAGYAKLEATRNVWDNVWTDEEGQRFLDKYAVVDKPVSVAALAEDDGHFVAHDYARDVVREYFDAVTDSVDGQWRLYERLCGAHMCMSGIADKSFVIDF